MVSVSRDAERRLAEVPSAPLWIGLLTKRPNADGNGFAELQADGYSRQELLFPRRAGGVRVPDLNIRFEGLPSRITLWGAGVFDGAGCLLCSGVLIPHETAQQPIYWLPSVTPFAARD